MSVQRKNGEELTESKNWCGNVLRADWDGNSTLILIQGKNHKNRLGKKENEGWTYHPLLYRKVKNSI